MNEPIQMWVDEAAKEIWDFVEQFRNERWPESVIPSLAEIIAKHAKHTTSYSAASPEWLTKEADK
jgi:hypothetical protein